MNTENKPSAEYPESYHGGERPRTLRRRFWIAFFLILLVIGAVTFFAQRGANSTSIDGAHSEAVAALSTSWKSIEARTTYTAPVATPRDWHKDDGTYQVGYLRDQIPPGLYTVTENPEAYVGYFAICENLMCLPGDGMDVNSIVRGQDYLIIKPDTFAVQLRGLLVEAS